MAGVTSSFPSPKKRRERASVATWRPPGESEERAKADDRARSRASGCLRPCSKGGQRASSWRHRSSLAVLAGSTALLIVYVLHETLLRQRLLTKTLEESRRAEPANLDVADDEKLQQSIGTSPGKGRGNDAYLSTNWILGKTRQEKNGKKEYNDGAYLSSNWYLDKTHREKDEEQPVSSSEVQVLATQGDDGPSVAEVSRRGGRKNLTFVNVVRFPVQMILAGLRGVIVLFLRLLQVITHVFKMVRGILYGVTYLGNTVLTSLSVLLTAITVSAAIVGLQLLILPLTAALPATYLHSFLQHVFGRWFSMLALFLHWGPPSALVLLLFLLAAYRVVLRVPVPALIGRALGIALAYAAQLGIPGLSSAPLPLADPTWAAFAGDVSYLAALSAFLSVDFVRWLSIRPFMIGFLTVYILWQYATASI